MTDTIEKRKLVRFTLRVSGNCFADIDPARVTSIENTSVVPFGVCTTVRTKDGPFVVACSAEQAENALGIDVVKHESTYRKSVPSG
jgi:hypothetical protein